MGRSTKSKVARRRGIRSPVVGHRAAPLTRPFEALKDMKQPFLGDSLKTLYFVQSGPHAPGHEQGCQITVVVTLRETGVLPVASELPVERSVRDSLLAPLVVPSAISERWKKLPRALFRSPLFSTHRDPGLSRVVLCDYLLARRYSSTPTMAREQPAFDRRVSSDPNTTTEVTMRKMRLNVLPRAWVTGCTRPRHRKDVSSAIQGTGIQWL